MIDKSFADLFEGFSQFNEIQEDSQDTYGKSNKNENEFTGLDFDITKYLQTDIDTSVNEIERSDFEIIMEYAFSVKASDIHFVDGSKPAVRLNKIMKDIPNTEVYDNGDIEDILEKCMDEEMLEKLKINGEIDFSFEWNEKGYFRANAFKQKGKYSLVLRRIPAEIPEFEELKLPHIISEFAQEHKGLVLITGATGSGKSTTLASLIDLINREKQHHIITIEDPIEYVHSHKKSKINQREVGNDTKSFATALKSALREDPDVILVGEMRDPETISIALTAAETGHLVFSTLHTIGAAKTIDRIVDTFPPAKQPQVRSQLSTVLKGVVSQELVPKVDKEGIIPAVEVMKVNSAIGNLIREGKIVQMDSIIQTASSEGMITMDQCLADLTLSGSISQIEAERRSINKEYYRTLLQRGR
ncbi:type IV pilus twitching motility protein PilT [Fusibacter sp. JL216-2]|uniref:type IV pilus twitching motility protein PilT n=1 Tax=Fusibacter sp. JL216-2 TaxID=3071453 RepID=UPI003D352059